MERFADERGETLTEIMITIMIMGIGLVAIVGALTTSIVSSSAHRNLAEAEVTVRAYGEAIKDRVAGFTDHKPCNGSSYAEAKARLEPGAAFATAYSLPTGFQMPAITTIHWWAPDPISGAPSWTTSPANCLAAYAACGSGIPACDPGLQRVGFTVTHTRSTDGTSSVPGSVTVRRNNVT